MNSRRLDRFPPEYHELFLRAVQQPIQVELASSEEAHLLRAQLYNFRSAIYQHPEKAPKLALIAESISLSIEDNVLTLSLKHPPTDSIKEALNA